MVIAWPLLHTAGASRKRAGRQILAWKSHGSRLLCGQRHQSNWGEGIPAQGAERCSSGACSTPEANSAVFFHLDINKHFATQTWGLVPIALLPLHHTQPHVLCPGQGEILLSSWAGHATTLSCHHLLRAATKLIFFTMGAIESVAAGSLSEQTLLIDMFMELQWWQ